MSSKSGARGPNGWYQHWQGKTVVIAASGPSALTVPLEATIGRVPVLAVKETWRLAPWAKVLYGCDDAWWIVNNGVPEFTGLKITSNYRCSDRFPNIYRVRFPIGNNSGTRAIFLAQRYMAKRVVLVGFDMHSRVGVHWHGLHPPTLRNATPDKMEKWRTELDGLAQKFAAEGLEIVNASPSSALTAYPFVPFLEAIDGGHDAHPADQQGHRHPPQ